MKTTLSLFPTMRLGDREEQDVFHQMLNTLDSTFFNDPLFGDFFAFQGPKSTKFPKIDVWETQTAYEVEANVAGLNKYEVNVEVNDNYLTLSGEKKENHKSENGKYLVSELSYKRFHRQIPILGVVNKDGVEAKYDNGILRITLPKLVEVKPESKKIEIK
jgi:HSP20 family protein